MSRRTGYRIVAVLVLLLSITVAAGYWLLGTPQGGRWLLGAVARSAAAELTITTVEGRLWDRLRLTGLTLRQAEQSLRLDELTLRWKLRELLSAHLEVTELTVTKGTIDWFRTPVKTDPTPQDAAFYWPQLSDWSRRIAVDVEALEVHQLHLILPATELVVERFAVAAHWREAILTLTDLDLVTRAGHLHADLSASFVQPLLQLNGYAELNAAVAEIDRVDFALTSTPQPQSTVQSGTFQITATHGETPLASAAATLTLTPAQLRLQPLRIERAGRAGALTGQLLLDLPLPSRFALALNTSDLDLAEELGLTTDLHGQLKLQGNLEQASGQLSFVNRADDWRAFDLATAVTVRRSGATFSLLRCAWLGGQLSGAVEADWQQQPRLLATLAGRNLDPSLAWASLTGTLNFDSIATIELTPDGRPDIQLDAGLLDSIVWNHPLTGQIDAHLSGDELTVTALELEGQGLNLSAHGEPARRIDFDATVVDLARFSTGETTLSGSAAAAGWLRYATPGISSEFSVTTTGMSFADLDLSAATLDAQLAAEGTLAATLTASDGRYGNLHFDTLRLDLGGQREQHTLHLNLAGNKVHGDVTVTGSYDTSMWSGTLDRINLTGTDFGTWQLAAQAPLTVSRAEVTLLPLRLTSNGERTIEIEGVLRNNELMHGEARWNQLDLALNQLWLEEPRLTGTSSGELRVDQGAAGHLAFTARQQAHGTLRWDDLSVAVTDLTLTASGDDSGFRLASELLLADGGRLHGRLGSTAPLRSLRPQEGTVDCNWEGLDLELVRSFIPPPFRLDGTLRGEVAGRWFAGERLNLSGSAAIDGGHLHWQDGGKEVSFALATAGLDWRWYDAALAGKLKLALTGYGTANGSFHLPLAARLPPVFGPDAPFTAQLTAALGEQGLLAALFPELVNATRGELTVELNAVGSWREPQLAGELTLAHAAGYLPAVGIELTDIFGAARLDPAGNGTLRVQMHSGAGQIEQQVNFQVAAGRIAAFEGTLKGDNFRIVHLPEIEVICTPDLRFQGQQDKIELRGEVLVPELRVEGRDKRELVRPSRDVRLVGESTTPPRSVTKSPWEVDGRVKIVLGDHVLVKAGGVDARLSGAVEVAATSANDLRGWGRINVAQGQYSGYGVSLNIERGTILFAGGPIDLPTLDILALRTIGTVKSGVLISGTPRRPVIKLYAEPTMSETDILSYVVLGRPMDSGSAQIDPLMTAAGLLLSQGESAMVQDRLKRMFGIDVIAVSAGNGENSMVTLGKYLTPDLYLSFGKALFGETNLVQMRYRFFKHWDLESSFSDESGADIHYQIEFD
ncbi:MAG: translocation/assembly module TamB domain-containing protein [Desulfuromonadaceae bacterium]|nr:translocation/assembly module TamB domain-containing protein [Desulfuromonadaceae bacterium]